MSAALSRVQFDATSARFREAAMQCERQALRGVLCELEEPIERSWSALWWGADLLARYCRTQKKRLAFLCAGEAAASAGHVLKLLARNRRAEADVFTEVTAALTWLGEEPP